MSAPVNPFSSVVSRLQNQKAQVNSSLSVAAQESPESGLAALNLESLTGVPAGAITDTNEIERIHRTRSIARDEIAKSPFLQDFLKTPPKAKAFLFVQPELLALRDALHTPPSMKDERNYRRALGRTNVRGGELVIGYLRGTLTPEEQAEYESLKKDLPLDPDLARSLGLERGVLDEFASAISFLQVPGQVGGIERVIGRRMVGAATEQLPLLLKQTPQALLYGAAGAVVGGLAATAAAVPGAGPAAPLAFPAGASTGATAGAAYGGFKGSFETELFGSLTEFEQVAKPGTSRELIVGTALVAAGVKGALDAASFANLAAKTPGLKTLFAKAETLSATSLLQLVGKDQATATVLQKFGAAYLAAIASETITEPIQEVVDISASAALSGKPLLTKENLDRVGDAMAQAGFASTILGGAGPLLTARRERAMGAKTKRDLIERSEAMHEHVAELVAKADELAKLRDAAPEAHRELVQGIATEEGQSDIFITPAKLLDLWGKAGKGAADLPGSVREQVGDALATGRDLVIPVGEYLTYLHPVIGEQAKGSVRLGPDLLDADEIEVLSTEVEADLTKIDEVDDIPEGATPFRDAALFNSAEDAGMTENEFQTYTRLRDEAAARPTARIEDGKVRELARRRGLVTRVLKARDRVDAEENAALRKAVESEFAANPVWRADQYLRTGKLPGAPNLPAVKLSRSILMKMFGNTPYALAVEKLPTGRNSIISATDDKPVLAGGGIHPDAIAEHLGFASGEQMVRALLDAGAADAGSMERAIGVEVEKRINAAEGRAPSETELTLLRSTLEDDIKIDRLIMEERSLSKKVGEKSTPRRVLQRVADRITREGVVSKMRPDLYRAAAERSRRNTLKAMKDGNLPAAAAYVRREALNRMLAVNAVEARHETAKALRDLKKWRSSAGIREALARAGGEWLAQWEGVYERVDLKRRSAAARASLAAFSAEAARNGDAFILPDWLLEGRVSFQDMTLDQIRGLRATVASIQNAGRRSAEVKLGEQRARLDETAAAVVAEVASLPSRAVVTKRAGEPSAKDQRRSAMRAIDATNTRKESLIAAIAGLFPTESTLYRTVVQRLQDSQSKHDELVVKYGTAISEIYRDMPKAERVAMHEVLPETRLTFNGQPLEVTRWDLVTILLNLGNDSNRMKLLEGYGWDEATVRDVIEKHATESDVRLAIRTQAIVESLWPEVEAFETAMTGVKPEKIAATPFRAKGIDVPGGYWPVLYDHARSNIGQSAALAEVFEDRPAGFSYVATRHNFTISRTEVAAPLLLRFDQVLTRHLDEVLIDLSFREALLDVSRLLRHEAVNNTMKEVLGPEFGYANFWRPWLSKIARDSINHGSLTQEERWAQTARFHIGVYRLGLRATTLMVQPSSLSNAVNTLAQTAGIERAEAARRLAEAVHLTTGRFSGEEATRLRRAVHELSPFMRNRVRTGNPEYRDLVRRLMQENSLSLDVAEATMGWIAKTQYHTADLPTWVVAHRIARDERGMDGKDSVNFADAAVRLAHGAGSKIDLPATLGESSEVARLFKMFYNYPNTVYNQIRQTARRGGASEVIASYWWSLSIPAAWGATIASLNALASGDDPDEAIIKGVRRFFGDHFSLLWWGRWLGDSLTGSGAPRDADATGVIMRELADASQWSSPQDVVFDVLRAAALARGVPGEDILRRAEDLLTPEESASRSRSR